MKRTNIHMTREEYKAYRYIASYPRHGFTLNYGTTLTIPTDSSVAYKARLHAIYTEWGFHPASVRVDPVMFDDEERIIYIYGLTWDFHGIEMPWYDLMLRREIDTIEAALGFSIEVPWTGDDTQNMPNELRTAMLNVCEATTASDVNQAASVAVTEEIGSATEAGRIPASLHTEVIRAIEATRPRSAWGRGVKAYAVDLVDSLDPDQPITEMDMLNGARDWQQYSEGGCALIYDCDIAEALCAPWELRRTDHGRKNPNPSETWIDVQTRALYQAARLVMDTTRAIIAKREEVSA